MIDLYFTPSPNTWKVSIMLEECGLAYRVVPVDIGKGKQFAPGFLRISPNNRVPAIVDHDSRGAPQPVFESGAILIYLAEKTGLFFAPSGPDRVAALEWLFWQIGGLGPISGQAHHFRRSAPPGNDHALERYTTELDRLYGVLDRRLEGRDWIAGDYSIADIACWGWVWFNGPVPDAFPNIGRWAGAMAARPGVARGRRAGFETLDEAGRSRLSGPWYDA